MWPPTTGPAASDSTPTPWTARGTHLGARGYDGWYVLEQEVWESAEHLRSVLRATA
ncbi:hypothetical protein [Streptomyces sp. NPDC004270]